MYVYINIRKSVSNRHELHASSHRFKLNCIRQREMQTLNWQLNETKRSNTFKNKPISYQLIEYHELSNFYEFVCVACQLCNLLWNSIYLSIYLLFCSSNCRLTTIMRQILMTMMMIQYTSIVAIYLLSLATKFKSTKAHHHHNE